MSNLFLTGEIQVGKSTVLKKVLERVNTSIGGYITRRVTNGSITRHVLRSLYDNMEEVTIAEIDSDIWSKEFFVNSFNKSIPTILDKSMKDRELIVLDELGTMENNIYNFTSKVYELLDSEKKVFGVIKDADCKFLNDIRLREDTKIIRVTKENRDYIIKEVIKNLKHLGVPFKKKTDFSWNKKRIDLYNEALEHPSSEYPNSFINEIKRHTGNLENKTILDIGAGTGAFSIPFMKEGAHVTAIDSSFNMMESLIQRARNEKLNNIKGIITPFEKSSPFRHDISLAAFAGSSVRTRDNIKRMCNLTNEYAFIISSFENHKNNFKANILKEKLKRNPKKDKSYKNTREDTLEILDKLNYKYEYKEIEYEFSQYFNSFNEAIDFFEDRFNIIDDYEFRILNEFLDEYLLRKEGQYIFENIKNSGIVAINICR